MYANEPLEYCPDYPAIALRFEGWWEQECIDRPVFVSSVNKRPDRPITRRLELVHSPDRWIQAKIEDLDQTHRVGDALPVVRADFGPVFLGAILGAELKFGANTGWTKPFVNDDWSNFPACQLDTNNFWLTQLRLLTDRVIHEAQGKFLYCTPDLGGSGDVLMNLRGPEGLCTDVMLRPDIIRTALETIYPVWQEVFWDLYSQCEKQNVGLVHWLQIYSSVPYIVSACDFNYMIGPEEFNNLFLPDIARKAEEVGRAVFHLDGPGAARHIDALLEIPQIRAIQFTPGEGTPSVLPWIPMFKKIQDKKRSLYIICPAEEVLILCDVLHPDGFGMLVEGCTTVQELDSLFTSFCHYYQ